MTRINLVPVEELMDQHLFAEFREMKFIPSALKRSILARGVEGILRWIPKEYTLGTGHVSFFYDKGLFLDNRYQQIRVELTSRGYKYNPDSAWDPSNLMAEFPWAGSYLPSQVALYLSRQRISERIALKPTWYRYRGVPQRAT